MGRKARKKKERRNQGRRDPTSQSERRKLGKWLAGIVTGMVLLGSGAWWWNSSFESSSLELMLEPAPRFALPASTGKTVRLEDYLGKQDVVLFFYMFAS